MLVSALETSIPLDFFTIHESLKCSMIHQSFLLLQTTWQKEHRLLECMSFVQSRGGEALTAILNLTWQNLSQREKCNYFIFTSSSPLCALASMSWMKAHCGFGFFFRNKMCTS